MELAGESADEADVARRGFHWSKRSFTIAAATCLVAVLLLLPAYRQIYDEWPWTTYPSTLHICGRVFQSGGSEEGRAQIAAKGYHLIRHGDAPGPFNTAPLWTFDTVDGQATGDIPGGCHVVMWIQGGGDSYHDYVLEGGP